jgi:HEAT repeat protein
VGLLCGCASFFDDVSSSEFNVKNWFKKPNPLVVIRDSNDGNQRAAALRSLQEPLQHGGDQQAQDVYVAILVKTASSDRDPLCRLAAIRAMGRFKDPRVVDGLQNAYYQATAFTPETNTIVRQQILTALGQIGHPAARDLLIKVVKEPPVGAEGSEQEKQQLLDVRLTAIRALGKFKHYEATEALVHVLKTERDVAVRDRAHEALQNATGQDLPPDAVAWENFLQQAPHGPPPEEKSLIRRVVGGF